MRPGVYLGRWGLRKRELDRSAWPPRRSVVVAAPRLPEHSLALVSRDEEEDDYTELSARPLPASAQVPDRSPDAIFRSFVANAYEESASDPGRASPEDVSLDLSSDSDELASDLPTRTGRRPLRRPVPSVNASLRNTEQWASSVEELLDDDEPDQADEPTMVAGVPAPKRPVASLADDPEERRDTEPPPPARPTPREPVRRSDVAASLARGTGSAEPTKVLAKPLEEGTLRVVLLTKKKPGKDDPIEGTKLDWEAIDRGAIRVSEEAPLPKIFAPAAPPGDRKNPEWNSLVPSPSTSTQKREALKLVPDVAAVEAPLAPPPEGSEDGMMPGGELDRKLGDMAVLLRYGHELQVRRELDHLTAEFPRDLLLLRRISEFWVGNQRHNHACDALFTLASGLFERRNMEGMRQALEQVLVLSPGNERATRLLGLLAERPEGPRRS